MNTPFLVRGNPVENQLGIAIGFFTQKRRDGFHINWWLVQALGFAKIAHPLVILIELLPACQRAPGNHLVDIGVTGIIGNMLIFQTGPGRRTDYFPRLSQQVMEANFFILFGEGQMTVVSAGKFPEGLPRLDCHLTIGLGGQAENHLGSINCRFNFGAAFVNALFAMDPVELTEKGHLVVGIPVNALATIAKFFQHRPERGEALIGIRIIALDDHHIRCCLSRNKLALALPPGFNAIGLGQFCWRIMLKRYSDKIFLDAEMTDCQFTETLGNRFKNIPIGTRFPNGVHSLRQRVNKRMHI